jgi:hypothetical protein
MDRLKGVPIQPVGVAQRDRLGLHPFNRASQVSFRQRRTVWL